MQQPRERHVASTDLDVGPLRAQSTAEPPTQSAADSSRLSAERPGPRTVWTHAIHEVVILEVVRLSNVVGDVHHSIQPASTKGAHSVVFDQRAVLECEDLARINPRNVHTEESSMSPTDAGKVAGAASVASSFQ